MAFIKSILFHLKTNILGLSTRVLGILLIVDLLAISAEAKPQTDQINLTTNKLTAQPQDFQPRNFPSLQRKILAILENRFDNIPDPLVEQVNQVSDPLFLKQLYQIAEVTSSPEAFQNALTSMVIQEENTTSLTPISYLASDLYQEKDIELLAQTEEKSPLKENAETPNSETDTENEATTDKPKKSFLSWMPPLNY